jgi:hypothetical protein
MRLTRRRFLLSPIALVAATAIAPTRPTAQVPPTQGCGLAELAVQAAPHDWHGVFSPGEARWAVAGVTHGRSDIHPRGPNR